MSDRDTLISREENLAMFDEIAERYDVMNRVISLGLDRKWRAVAVETLAVRSEGRYLDIGCGTGDLGLDILKVAPSATVVGIDPSAGMLRAGMRKQNGVADRNRFPLAVGDAVYLPFADACFDGIILGFVIRNVEQRVAALSEIFRVLRPGGRTVILELGVPQNPWIRPFFKLHTRTLVPISAKLFTKKGAYDYLVRSVEAFPPPDEFLALLTSGGFAEAACTPLTFGAVNLFSGVKRP